MIGILRAFGVTLKTMLRKPVTVQYPDAHLPISPRMLGFPALLWDTAVDEPACVGCKVCERYCPTDCITVTMMDNPLAKEGKSTRRKMVDNFEVRMERCILCGICVEVCNFEAIAMTDYHEQADTSRGGLLATKADLFRMGRDFQQRAGIKVTPGTPKAAPAAAPLKIDAATPPKEGGE